jgi:hypothetical protein
MAKNTETESDFQYIKEDDYKTLISVYQQKTFDLFNQNIALEAKVATLNSLIKELNNTIEEMIKVQEKQTKRTSKSRSKAQSAVPEITASSEEGETF